MNQRDVNNCIRTSTWLHTCPSARVIKLTNKILNMQINDYIDTSRNLIIKKEHFYSLQDKANNESAVFEEPNTYLIQQIFWKDLDEASRAKVETAVRLLAIYGKKKEMVNIERFIIAYKGLSRDFTTSVHPPEKIVAILNKCKQYVLEMEYREGKTKTTVKGYFKPKMITDLFGGK